MFFRPNSFNLHGKTWLTTQSSANRSLPQIPCYQGKIQGNSRNQGRRGICIALETSVSQRLSRSFPKESNREFWGREQGNCCPEKGIPFDLQVPPSSAQTVTAGMYLLAYRKRPALGAMLPSRRLLHPRKRPMQRRRITTRRARTGRRCSHGCYTGSNSPGRQDLLNHGSSGP